ncbi:hypothetical protein ACW9PK_07245 [Kocuria sp. MNB10]
MPEDLDLDDNPLEADDKDKPSRTFSQDELDRIVSREKDQAKRSVAKQLQEQLGVSIEEARTILDEARKRSDAEKTEAQREREAAAKAKADADAERAEAVRDRHVLRLERNLLKAGVPDAALSRVARMVDVEVGADDVTLSDAITSLKDELPSLFEAKTADERKQPPSSDPKGKPKQPSPDDDSLSKGAERAKKHYGSA